MPPLKNFSTGITAKTNLEINVFNQVFVIGCKELVAKVFNTKPQRQRQLRRSRALCTYGNNKLTQLILVAKLVDCTHKRHVHARSLGISIGSTSTTPRLPMLPPPRVSHFTLFISDLNGQGRGDGHHREPAGVKARNVVEMYSSTGYAGGYYITPSNSTATLATVLIKDIESVKHTSGTFVQSTKRSQTNVENMTEPTKHDLLETI